MKARISYRIFFTSIRAAAGCLVLIGSHRTWSLRIGPPIRVPATRVVPLDRPCCIVCHARDNYFQDEPVSAACGKR